MAIPFLIAIDLNKNEVQNARIQNLAVDPGTPVDGQIYYNTVDKTIREYDATATAWRVLAWVGATTPVAEAVGSAAQVGTAIEASRADHRHAMPGVATPGVDGFMPGADKTKLDAATASPTVSTIIMRDASGRAQVVDPSAAADIATKSYVDSVAQGLDAKASVRVATVAALAITARTAQTLTIGGTSLTIDAVATADGDRVLVKDSTTGTGAGTHDNGIYVVSGIGSSVVLTRTTDADTWLELPAAFTFIEEGTTNAENGWVCTVDAGGTLGTTAVTWVQFSSAGVITASNGILRTGNNLTGVVVGGGGLLVGASGFQIDTAIVARHVAAAIGDGVATQIDMTHSLGTRDVVVNVYRVASPYETVMCDTERFDVNTVRLRFAVAPTAGQFRVVVTG